MSRGFAVVDVETTGLFPAKHDRIVEIAVVHVSPDGEIEGRWETLVNPMRDMGPQRIHGITAIAASRGPSFNVLARQIAELLDDRVPVAHNAVFDANFVGTEMAAAGIVPPASDQWLCTMRTAMSVDSRAGRSLVDCCSWAGVEFTETHNAGADAEATAHLLRTLMLVYPDSEWWSGWLGNAPRFVLPPSTPVPFVPRHAASKPAPSLIQRLKVTVDEDAQILNTDYLALLDRVLLDRLMSETEQDMLLDLANSLGIGPTSMQRMHRAYFAGVVSAAWQDGELSADEIDDVRAVGRCLGIPEDEVAEAVAAPPAPHPIITSGFRLEVGDTIVITGETQRSRPEWFAILEAAGFIAKDSITKTARLLVAADPDSMSTKARKAREYGIPIVSEEGLERLLAQLS